MKIAVLAIGPLSTASTWYRIGQYIPYLEKKGFKVDFLQLNCSFFQKLPSYDLLFVQKVLPPTHLIKKIFRNARHVVFDFDDAIWTRPGRDFFCITRMRVRRRLATWLESADQVFVPNQILKSEALRYRDRAELLPMAIDLTSYPLRTTAPPETLGWSGAPHNLTYLKSILPALKESSLPLHVFSGKVPTFPFPFHYSPYIEGGEAPFLQNVGVGLLPLPEDRYARGKSPIKALQYMASSIPFVASGKGGVEELLGEGFAFHARNKQEWIEHLHFLSAVDVRERAGKRARSFVEKHHDLAKLKDELIRLISKIP